MAVDRAVGIGTQFGVAGLVAADTRLSAHRFELRLGRLETGLLAIKFGTADEAGIGKLRKALEVGLLDRELRFLRADRCPAGAFIQRQILGIEAHQQVALADSVTDIGLAAVDLSGHPESEVRLVARPHFAGKVILAIGLADRDHHGAHGPNFRGGLGRLATGDEQGRQRSTDQAGQQRVRKAVHGDSFQAARPSSGSEVRIDETLFFVKRRAGQAGRTSSESTRNSAISAACRPRSSE